MKSRLFRVVTATSLVFTLWGNVLLAAQDTQDLPPPPPPKPKPVEPAKAETVPQTTAPAPAKQAQAQPTPAKPDPKKGKPLSTDEDPAMIGKRKLNSGIIASMSGSLEKEVAIGRQLAAEIEKELKMVDDPVITEYINRVGQNIVLHSDAKVPFTIKVVDSDEVNAFALPGGFFFVNKGLILAADNESEIAGVMAHEIAHVTARHAMEQQAKGMLANIGLNVGQIFLPGLGGLAVLTGAQFLTTLGFLKFSRAAEEEADKLGLQYMYAAGYDPSGMATMFEKLAAQNKKKPGKVAKLFSTHPQSDNRRVAVLNLAARFPEQEEYVISTSEFQKVKGRLLRLSNARATTSGVIADDGDSGRPTLKRRLPSGEGATTPSDSNNKTEEPAPDRPTLRRGDTKPTPTPTPEP